MITMWPAIIIIAVILVLVLVIVGMYNGLVRLNVRADEAWSDITVQLKRRYDLIPNLVNTVKGYATHEKTVFEDVTKARSQAMQAQGPAETAKAENQFSQTLKSLFAVAESYPQLRASENFQQLQAQLTDTEDKIMASRRFYNGVVRDFNTKRKVFPTNVFAGMLGFNKDKEFFELDDAAAAQAAAPVEVKF
ncbi:MAG TPA: LemA family protein [Candidatus Saccharimonadales bacterium]|nr:LemA family protein [Candidatus Saccharimonadales bacterium]